jgi:histidinol-phosphate aminotransferase
MNLESLVRPNILRLKPYSSGKSEFSGKAEIFLDTNENPFGDNILNRYPDPLQLQLKKKISEVKSHQFKTEISSDSIALGNGSDELLDQVFRIFCEPKQDSVVVSPPTFGMYEVLANCNDVECISVPLGPDFYLNVEEILQNAKSAKILFLCHPNNPTGNAIPLETVDVFLRDFPGIIILDEAYIDFCPEKSLLPKIKSHPHLIVLQTFSKAWGMAGARLGMAFAHPDVISLFLRIKTPYNINVLTANKAIEKLADPKTVAKEIEILVKERKRMEKELQKIPTVKKVFPSDANFLLIKMENAQAVHQIFLENGIVVRNVSDGKYLRECIRVSVGSPLENDAVIRLLQSL